MLSSTSRENLFALWYNRIMTTKATLEDVREFIRHADSKTMKLLLEIWNSRYRHLQAETAMEFVPGEEVTAIFGKRPPRRVTGIVVGADRKGHICVQSARYQTGLFRGNHDLVAPATMWTKTGKTGVVKP